MEKKMSKPISFRVSKKLKKEMDKYDEVTWSKVCQSAIGQYVDYRKGLQAERFDPKKVKKR